MSIVLTAASAASTTPTPQPDGLMRILHVIGQFYSNGIDDHIYVFLLFCIIFLDIALGVGRAWAQKNLSSRRWRPGIIQHAAVFTVVAIWYPILIFISMGSIADMFVMAIIASYGASVLKNLSLLGVKIPYLDKFIEERIDRHKNILLIDTADYTEPNKSTLTYEEYEKEVMRKLEKKYTSLGVEFTKVDRKEK